MTHSRNTRLKFRKKLGLVNLPRNPELLPSAREWYRYLREERLRNPAYRNIINERGELV